MAKVAQMTKDELREMIEITVEQKLLELLGDPDEGLPIRKAVRDRLLRQKQAVASGERGEPFEDVIRRLASQDLARLDKPIGRRIVQRINWLAANLDAIRLEALTGDLAGLYKLRVGHYRVIYEVLWDEETIVIHAIGHRREIYRRR